MVKLSKTAIGLISGSSALLIAGGTITASLLLKKEDKTVEKSLDPLNRGNNYHPYSLVDKIKTNTKLQDLVRLEKTDNSFIYIIDESRFKNNIKTIVQETLKSISLFSSNWNNYKVEVTYKIEKISKISIDIVWYLPDSKYKYFDQFDLILEVI